MLEKVLNLILLVLVAFTTGVLAGNYCPYFNYAPTCECADCDCCPACPGQKKCCKN